MERSGVITLFSSLSFLALYEGNVLMKKSQSMRKNRLLIVLFTCVTALLVIVSCTYDYFEDETNYIVVVPEVLDNSIDDCRVMIYDAAGTLVKERYAAYPWNDGARIMRGEFTFRLPAGEYKVYCYTNTGGVTFIDNQNLETSAFTLNEENTNANTYVQPSDMFFQVLNRSVIHPGMLHTDTTEIDRYVGRIVVRFKNPPMTAAEVSKIANVNLKAEGAATKQYLKKETVTDRISENDVMANLGALSAPTSADVVEVDHLYLPTVNDGKIMQLDYTFLDAANGEIISIPVVLADEATGTPIQLSHGQKLIVEVDKYVVVKVSLVGWNEDIHGGGTNLE